MSTSPESARATARTSTAREWWQGAVIYENHMASMRDGNGDGIGDIEGLIESLDYLHDLGIDAIWTSPFYTSPLYDQGFDVSNFVDVEPVFGSLEAFDRLVAEAHARGIRIIVDYIPNHTSHLHPWFIESRASRTNPRADWYVWLDPAPNGGPPNNWTSEAGGSVWELDETRGQYFLHSHLVEQPDLNWRNPEVVAALHDVLRFWLARGADGFRIDVAHMLMKHPDYLDNPPATTPGGNLFDLQHPDFGTQLHVHDRRYEDTHDTLRGIRSVVDEYPGAVTIAEIEAMSWPDWAEYYGTGLTGMHLPFAFRLIELDWDATVYETELRDMYAALPNGAWPILALGNHDRTRLATRIGQAQARVATMMLLSLRGTPCFLYGDELGLEDHLPPLERQRDYFARATGGVTRDPARRPMAWTTGHNAGFSTASAEKTWLPVPPDAGSVSVEVQLEQPESALVLNRDLIALRRGTPALIDGDIEILSANAGVLAFVRELDGDRVAVVLNLRDEPVESPLTESGVILLSTLRAHDGLPLAAGASLAANEGIVVRLETGIL